MNTTPCAGLSSVARWPWPDAFSRLSCDQQTVYGVGWVPDQAWIMVRFRVCASRPSRTSPSFKPLESSGEPTSSVAAELVANRFMRQRRLRARGIECDSGRPTCHRYSLEAGRGAPCAAPRSRIVLQVANRGVRRRRRGDGSARTAGGERTGDGAWRRRVPLLASPFDVDLHVVRAGGARGCGRRNFDETQRRSPRTMLFAPHVSRRRHSLAHRAEELARWGMPLKLAERLPDWLLSRTPTPATELPTKIHPCLRADPRHRSAGGCSACASPRGATTRPRSTNDDPGLRGGGASCARRSSGIHVVDLDGAKADAARATRNAVRSDHRGDAGACRCSSAVASARLEDVSRSALELGRRPHRDPRHRRACAIPSW